MGLIFYAKRENKQAIYTRIQKMVIETVLEEKLSYGETARRFEVCNIHRSQSWELKEGLERLAIERRGRKSTDISKKLPKEVEEVLIAENQRLRAENEYLKNLKALVLDRERQQWKNLVVQKLRQKHSLNLLLKVLSYPVQPSITI